jgi:hypothetical protein
MNPVVTLINLLAVAPAVLGRTVGLQVSGIRGPLAWQTLPIVPLAGWVLLLTALGLLLFFAGLKLFGECMPEE